MDQFLDGIRRFVVKHAEDVADCTAVVGCTPGLSDGHPDVKNEKHVKSTRDL